MYRLHSLNLLTGTCYVIMSILLAQPGLANDAGTPSVDVIKGLYPGKTYSPYADRSFPSQVFWGDTHLHTANSPDAGLFGNTLGLDDAYRFAKGKQVKSATGLPVKLARPLDWLVLTDHSDMMGFAPDLRKGAANILAVDQGKKWYEMLQEGGDTAANAALELISQFSQGTLPEKLVTDYSPGSEVYNTVWENTIDAAEKYNEPGTFTAFIGFEWTSVPKGNNLHRNVVFRDNGDRARQVQPMVTLDPKGSTDPLKLYEYLENYEKKTGGKVFALAHNGNLSNGHMFPTETTYHGGKVDEAYAKLVAKWEPLYEITQIKGDGETHPKLSPEDAFADYETWDAGNLDLSVAKTQGMLKHEYAREALKQGFALKKKLGVNPYRFGFSGATDSHTSLATAEEENFWGKAASAEPSKSRVNHPFSKTENGVFEGYELAASGYTGVWATENTREAIWDAMARRECYATTGPRIPVRLFGGWDFTSDDLRNRAPAIIGYKKGVPMGGNMRTAPKGAKAPTFMVYALRDQIGANLDRIQIVKGWMDKKGELHENVYDVAVSGNRKIDKNGRCKEAVGNTVDIEAANWKNTIGASELGSVWTDPDFDASEHAFYYARVLEIPTPRWVLYDKVRLGADVPKEAKLFDQERAYTSPIWYTP